jgi:hypothetical protein
MNDKKFGIEIEFICPVKRSTIFQKLVAKGIKVVSSDNYASNYHQKNNDYSNWMLASDSSVRESGNDGHELTSPPLIGEEGMRQLKIVLEVLSSFKAKINRTCGLHVHHEVDRLMDRNSLAKMFVKYQSALYAVISKNRESNHYCKPLPENFFKIANPNGDRGQRYYGLNFLPVDKGHIEFRLHHGSICYAEIRNWVILTQRLVEVSQKPVTRDEIKVKIIEILSSQMLSFDNLVREIFNQGLRFTEHEIKACLEKNYFSKISDGSNEWFTAIEHKSLVEEMLEVLDLKDSDIELFYRAREEMKNVFGDARVV